ncbi:hypothetical protein [Micromonospora sonneratiae]|uniref:Secreted protein n=1 Tax=Micromonospora sonneratiae TaxID=1184706 RepID=A0ABW3YJ91_9ACTN
MKWKLLLAAFAALVVAFGLSTPAQAHSTDDWTTIAQHPEQWPGHRYANASITGSETETHIDWSGTAVVVSSFVKDSKQDGWCAIVQIRYEIKTNDTWAGHWHYRVPKVDCTDGNGGLFSSIYYARYPTRSLHARACIGYADGTTYSCGAWQ